MVERRERKLELEAWGRWWILLVWWRVDEWKWLGSKEDDENGGFGVKTGALVAALFFFYFPSRVTARLCNLYCRVCATRRRRVAQRSEFCFSVQHAGGVLLLCHTPAACGTGSVFPCFWISIPTWLFCIPTPIYDHLGLNFYFFTTIRVVSFGVSHWLCS